MQVTLSDRSTHPPIGSWVWGKQSIPYRVTRRFKESGQFFIMISAFNGDRILPLSRVLGWCPELAVGTPIISNIGWAAIIIRFDPNDGMYFVQGDCIYGWLYPDQFVVIESLRQVDLAQLEELSVRLS